MDMSERVGVDEYDWGYLWMCMSDRIGVDGYALVGRCLIMGMSEKIIVDGYEWG